LENASLQGENASLQLENASLQGEITSLKETHERDHRAKRATTPSALASNNWSRNRFSKLDQAIGHYTAAFCK
jgi:regulator of replication initiation timing